MKKLMTVAAGLLVATSAFASTETMHTDTKVFSADYATKIEALNAGYDIADDITAMSEGQLRSELPLLANNTVRHISVDDTEISVEEFAHTRGEIQYRAVVDVDYHFTAIDND